MKSFQSKRVIVTGAASGMGRELAARLAQAGAQVLATDIEQKGLTTLAASNANIQIETLNVTDQEAFESLVNQFASQGGIDYIFNNAGIALYKEMKDHSLEEIRRLIDINQWGVVHGTLAAYEFMRKQGHGHIVNTASIAGLTPFSLLGFYSMTKHAVLGMTLTLRQEAKAYGVNVTAICPGIIKTNIAKSEDMELVAFKSNDPFAFMQSNFKIRPISAEKAVDHILKGVAKNDAEVVFPQHAKMWMRMFRHTRKLWDMGQDHFLRTIRAYT